jgi:hypothetical protein
LVLLQWRRREKMARLERENNRLKSEMGEGGAAEQIALLQAKLDDATALNATYEEKLRQLSARTPYVPSWVFVLSWVCARLLTRLCVCVCVCVLCVVSC